MTNLLKENPATTLLPLSFGLLRVVSGEGLTVAGSILGSRCLRTLRGMCSPRSVPAYRNGSTCLLTLHL